MPEVTPLPPELTRSVSALARRLVMTARTWTVYPLDRLGEKIERPMPANTPNTDSRKRVGKAVDPGLVNIDWLAER